MNRRLLVIMGLLIMATSSNLRAAGREAVAVPPIENWDQFIDGLKDLAPKMLSKLPQSMQEDPRIRQEVARVALESLATTLIKELAFDRDHPAFLAQINVVLNDGQPNADTTYRLATITPGGTYRLRGSKGSLRIAKIGQFGTQRAEHGHAGLYTITYDDLNSVHTDAEGHFDVILSPVQPPNYQGDWWRLDPATSALMIRMVGDDWVHEKDPTLSIERLDVPATRPRPTTAQMQQHLKDLGPGTADMALLLIDHVPKLESEGYVNKLKVFDVSQIGGQLTGQFYYEGAYDLKDDEALIMEAKVPEHCLYYSTILTNEVYETTDWYNNHSSLNDSQLRVDKDGVLRVVVSAQDPGVANWLDTAGYPRGAVQGRWTECSSQPVPTLKKVRFADVRNYLPKDTALVTAGERDSLVRNRRSLLQQRPLW